MAAIVIAVIAVVFGLGSIIARSRSRARRGAWRSGDGDSGTSYGSDSGGGSHHGGSDSCGGGHSGSCGGGSSCGGGAATDMGLAHCRVPLLYEMHGRRLQP